MSFSLSARKLAACWCSVVAIPVVVLGQNSFLTSGGEYSVTGVLPGDQLHPQVNFTTNGGYVVWQDYWADGNELGIGAMRLKSDLKGSGVHFRVNSQTAHDQENGQVSMLNNGGAVFAWQGGKMGAQHIYARFLSSSNNWLTGDVQVNGATNRFQVNPVMATLLNGNVAMVYESWNQAAPRSMSDVYLQIFAPNGNKIGSEILVNQFTDNNQRSPAVTALPNGNFAVAWVSEQQRWTDASGGVPSVDIYARVFDPTGTAAAAEFLINGDTNICAAPDITSTPDNGIMVSWMEKDLNVRNNGWDIFARRFTSAGVGVTALPVRVNTQLYGDQYSAKVRRAGTNYLDIWTSMGQDGSYEGVYGRYLADDGSVIGDEFQVNTSTVGSQMQQVLGTDGGRLLAVWSGFGIGVNGYDLYGQLYVNPSVAVNGTNDSVFNTDPNANPNSVSDAPPTGPGLPPPDTGGGGGSPSPTNYLSFADVKGTYNGLVYDPNAPLSVNSGYITVTTTARKNTGSFTAKLQLGTQKYSFSGVFDANGAYSAKLGTLSINLSLDLAGNDRITGQISNGDWTSQVLANRAVFSRTHPTSLAGHYTMIIQPGDGIAGNGIGILSVDASGNVKCSVTLPDGTKLSQSTTLSKTGAWPLFAVPYKSGGVAVGWLQFAGTSTDGFDGQCVWVKPAGAGTPYSGGLTNGITVSGSIYKAPPVSFRSFGSSKVILNGGGLEAPLTNSVTWGVNNKILSDKRANSLKLSLSPANGLFKGTVKDPASGDTVSFQGVLFEKSNVGLGFFLGSNQSGAVSFVPNP